MKCSLKLFFCGFIIFANPLFSYISHNKCGEQRSSRKALANYFYSKKPLKTRIESYDYGDGLIRWINVVEGSEEDAQKNYNSSSQRTLAPYQDNDEGLVDCFDLDDTYDIVCTKSGKFMTSFYVPAPLHAAIIGSKGSKLRELQENTGTLIKVPRPEEQGDVKITGHTERSVVSARSQIALLILNKRESMAITHFISVPLFSFVIENNFKIFKDMILKDPPRGVDETIFQKPEKVHLTISTLTLLDDIELQEAKKVLTECYEEIIEPLFPKTRRTQIVMKGVEIMNDDPTDVHVLYAKVKLDTPEHTNNFQKVADEIVNYFYKKGLVRKQYDRVKLHVTLMNTLFRKKPDDNYEKFEERSKRESFDATDILKQFASFHFNTCDFESIQLSIRFTTGANKYYESALTLPIYSRPPKN